MDFNDWFRDTFRILNDAETIQAESARDLLEKAYEGGYSKGLDVGIPKHSWGM